MIGVVAFLATMAAIIGVLDMLPVVAGIGFGVLAFLGFALGDD